MNFPLIPNTPFASGDPWTPELGYISLQPTVFDDQVEYFNHGARITDDQLSTNPGQLLDRVDRLFNNLKVTSGDGLTVNVNSGQFLNNSGELETIVGSSNLALTTEADNYVFIDQEGVIRVSQQPDTVRVLLAKVITSPDAIVEIEDLRFPNRINTMPVARTIKSFGGSNDTDKITFNGERFTNGYYYTRNFRVPAGTTLYVQSFARIFSAGYVSIEGTIVVETVANGAAPNTYGLGSTTVGNLTGSGFGSQGDTHPWSLQPYGSGGGVGEMSTSGSGVGKSLAGGGDGGGGLWIECASDINVSGIIYADGDDGGSVSGEGDYAIVGSGGGSGGTIVLAAVGNINVSGQLYARGGDGSPGVISSDELWQVSSGFGGGGGQIVIQAPEVNTTGSILDFSGGFSPPPVTNGSQTLIDDNNYRTDPNVVTNYLGNCIAGGNGGIGGYRIKFDQSGFRYHQMFDGAFGRLTIQNFIPIGN